MELQWAGGDCTDCPAVHHGNGPCDPGSQPPVRPRCMFLGQLLVRMSTCMHRGSFGTKTGRSAHVRSNVPLPGQPVASTASRQGGR
jgi:hypothetical protein